MNDYDLIVHRLPRDLKFIHIYPIGDTQIGSPMLDEKLLGDWVDLVKADPVGYVVMVGDMINNGLKGSKTNSYKEKYPPAKQKQILYEYTLPLQDRVLGAVPGNHEGRTTETADGCPLFDVMFKLDLEHLYRENMAFIKVSLGEAKADRQVSYSLVLAHGTTLNKMGKFALVIDNMDFLITGHIHDPQSGFKKKIVIDMHNETVKEKKFCTIVVPSMDGFGGYVARNMYPPTDSEIIPIITLSGEAKRKKVEWIDAK